MRLTRRPSGASEPDRSVPAELARLVSAVARSTGEERDAADGQEPVDTAARARELRALGVALARSARGAGGRAVLGGRWLVDTLLEAAPRLPLRDRETLRRHHPGLSDDEVAAALVRAAARATSVVGAAGGAAAAASWAVPPSLLLSVPVELAAETLAVAAVEVKLVAELHALRGVVPGATVPSGVPGGMLPAGLASSGVLAYVMSWANGRGIDPSDPRWMATTLGTAAKAQIRKRMFGRAARGVTSLGPLLTGAVAGAVVNGRATRSLGEKIDSDLRRSGRR
ncbi:hypothetical protein CLV35_1322 [Motilibacter peucedani]|uniref:EcsC family protein n=1 Tax=Motilibacter peucedani TaxID=598650 RepID=A0A420XRW5_9ACTN|nr:hypothetical protein [Motilibacter peucedani]RKS77628.1 hypothetical protein CLV35_1322 [Motilibacter peucedani]